MEYIYLLGNKISLITVKRLNEEIGNIVRSEYKEIIPNVNIHGINLANKFMWLKEFRNSKRIVFCDGQGVILGARMLGKSIPERIPVTEWLWNLSSYCAKNKFSIFFIGSKQDIVERAAERLSNRYPELMIKGVYHGFFDKDGIENEQVISIINQTKPDILVVAFGMPLQEKWLKDNWKRIDAKVFLIGGACFDYVSGYLKRGPKILNDNGLEWFCRLLIEPRRLWKRYLIGNSIFFFNILKEAIFRKVFNVLE